MEDGWWRGVRDRVLRLAGIPEAEGVFASFAHRFALEPQLAEREVEEAEELFGVRLPEDYRAFLTRVGAGGAGPAYGVFALHRTVDGWGWAAEDTHRTEVQRLGEPFSPQHVDGSAIDVPGLRRPAQYDFEYLDDYQLAYDRWQEVLWHPDRTAGAICLSDEGCLCRDWLVVTGDERGMIWRDHRIDGFDLSPLFDANGRRLTFSRWYLAWLDAAEHQAKR
ncbi:hypothetical protein J2S43_003674 [Catenuloplanes nepalensis]|uniref:Knr4/Smi1-like domain-containing protein n=1 Tax=Catenuloplanes nepalensis TaxID=587533 RepID=A0ABT9MUP0_9ACTN|nr:SMI1/KNR4 family protein [Catenuloplanes nepalensis]MDP9795162.1 hypothetical protein [Catenuloplanes nepalensis]